MHVQVKFVYTSIYPTSKKVYNKYVDPMAGHLMENMLLIYATCVIILHTFIDVFCKSCLFQ